MNAAAQQKSLYGNACLVLKQRPTREERRASYSVGNMLRQVRHCCQNAGRPFAGDNSVRGYVTRIDRAAEAKKMAGQDPVFTAGQRLRILNSPRGRRPYCDSTRRKHDRLLRDAGFWEQAGRGLYRWRRRPLVAAADGGGVPVKFYRSDMQNLQPDSPASAKSTDFTIYAAAKGGAPVDQASKPEAKPKPKPEAKQPRKASNTDKAFAKARLKRFHAPMPFPAVISQDELDRIDAELQELTAKQAKNHRAQAQHPAQPGIPTPTLPPPTTPTDAKPATSLERTDFAAIAERIRRKQVEQGQAATQATTPSAPQAACQAHTPGKIPSIGDVAAARAWLATQADEPPPPRAPALPAPRRNGRDQGAAKQSAAGGSGLASKRSAFVPPAEEEQTATAAQLRDLFSRHKALAGLGKRDWSGSCLPWRVWRGAVAGLVARAPGSVADPAKYVAALVSALAQKKMSDPRRWAWYFAHTGWGRGLLAEAGLRTLVPTP